jgi:hypothetical protein
MSLQTAFPFALDFFSPKPIFIQSCPLPLTSDAGLLPLRQFDHKIGFSQQIAQALDDCRQNHKTTHSLLDMVRARLFGILADYPDQNDHDTLRTDPVFKLLAGRDPIQGDDLASQPTLSRFENQVSIAALKRFRDVFIDQFIASFASPPHHLLFDLDAVDDPAHGEQQLALFHGFYDQYQYLPLIVTHSDSDQVVMVSLRPGNAHAALGADDDLRYLANRLRQVWPDVQLEVRGDAGFGMPWMYAVCEELGIRYTFGLASNPVLQRASETLLAKAAEQFEQTGQAQRLFDGFGYQAGTWSQPRWVVVKAEANAHGTNRRFLVTDRPGARVLVEAAYDAYAERGESENRNKELKCDLQMDRLSDHRFCANYFRLYLHAAALNLLVRLRREVAEPPRLEKSATVAEQKREQNRRRREDPLLIKVAAVVRVSCRRVVVELSGSWPHADWYRQVSEHVARRPAVAYLWTG